MCVPSICRTIAPAVAAFVIIGAAMAQAPASPPQKPTSSERKPGGRTDDGVRSLSPTQTPTSPGATPTVPGRPLRPGDVAVSAPGVPGAVNVQKGGAEEQLDSTPVIRFEPEELDLGDMQPEVPKSGKVKIVNISDKPITITRAIPSCGCTTPTWPKDPIPPGGTGEMEITLKPGAKAGVPLTKNVTLQIDGHAPVRYVLKGMVPEYVKMTPDIIEAPSSPDRPVSDTVKFTSVDGTAFRISNVTPAIIVVDDATKAAQQAATEHTMRIDWQKWTETGRGFRVQFATDHPKAPSLSVMVRRPIERNPATGERVDPTSTAANREMAARSAAASGVVFAAQRGDVEEVKKRLEAGDDPNATDPTSMRTALHWAARNNNVEIINLLLAKGADVRIVEKMGRPALALAAENGSVDAIKLLLAANADVNARDEHGGSALLWAAGLGSPESVKALLDAGADANIQDGNGMSPLMWAANVGDPRNVVVLASSKGIQLDAIDRISGETALMRAARNGKLDAVKILLERGASTDIKNQQGTTAFIFASQTGNLDTVRALAERKVDIKAKNIRGDNALDVARARTDAEGKRIAEYLASELKLESAQAASTPTAGATAAGAASKGG